MQIAIVSDIHDNVWNLAAALPHLRQADALLCCGDLCSPFVLAQLAAGFPGPVHVVFGNNDGDQYRLTGKAAEFGHVHLHGAFFRGEVAGVEVAMSHYPEVAHAVDASAVGLIAYGHDHRFHVGSKGGAQLVNPGPLMGWLPADDTEVTPTFVLFDTESGRCNAFGLTPEGLAEPHPG